MLGLGIKEFKTSFSKKIIYKKVVIHCFIFRSKNKIKSMRIIVIRNILGNSNLNHQQYKINYIKINFYTV